MILIIDLIDQEWQKKLNIFESTHMFDFQEKKKKIKPVWQQRPGKFFSFVLDLLLLLVMGLWGLNKLKLELILVFFSLCISTGDTSEYVLTGG